MGHRDAVAEPPQCRSPSSRDVPVESFLCDWGCGSTIGATVCGRECGKWGLLAFPTPSCTGTQRPLCEGCVSETVGCDTVVFEDRSMGGVHAGGVGGMRLALCCLRLDVNGGRG